MSSKILFTAGAKGGTGKSTAARLLITYLRQYGVDPLLLDLDDESSTLSRFFPEAQRIAIRKKSSHDVLIEQAIIGEPLILADLKAGTGREVLDWWLDLPFAELQSMDVSFVCLGSITSSPDSVQSFLTWVAALQDRVRYVVFKNLKDGEYLPDYEHTSEAADFRALFHFSPASRPSRPRRLKERLPKSTKDSLPGVKRGSSQAQHNSAFGASIDFYWRHGPACALVKRARLPSSIRRNLSHSSFL